MQAYQKRAWHVLRWLEDLGHSERRVIPVRLVKGAYWDTEIKRAQELGLEDYPVFTLKSNTDLSYLACAKLLLQESPHLYPQFATHNAQAVAWVLEHGSHRLFEFQRLHGMGEELYGELAKSQRLARPCRIYAPVGSHRDLLPYLVRRLLENGANTSFVNRLLDAEAPLEAIVADPVAATLALGGAVSHPQIQLPKFMFAPERKNSSGLNLADSTVRNALAHALANAGEGHWQTQPIVDGRQVGEEEHPQLDPADQRHRVGTVAFASAGTALAALESAAGFQPRWEQMPASARADCLRRAAELFETHAAELIARCVAEAGRTVPDSHAELREAVDFLRYYATQAERLYGVVTHLPGPTGEANRLRLRGRGVFLALSPWNFPLSIFTGQVAAALAAGNTVLAKPAEQSCLVAGRAVELLLESGIPPRALHWLPGAGPYLGAALLPDPRIAGVVFTGSHATALHINRTLAARRGALATLIAETGGINAMLVDNSALPEQVVRDTAYSAFNSAGQRCSALRLLCLPEQTADRVLEMLLGFVDTLVVGDPALLETDVGPVIDAPSKASLEEYVAANRGRVLYQSKLDASHDHGLFFPPTVVEVEVPAALTREVFGPVLHVLRYHERKLDELVDAINALGFGLTLGIHSRIESVAARVAARARVGNVYVNRNMIGAQVGVQPFGGMGLSGTGPKAGGPHYVERFGAEQALTTNTAAVGGNATLLSLGPSRTR